MSKLELLAVEPTRIRARVRLQERRLLASSVFHDGNWHLLDGGERRETIVANGPFLAAWLPPGEREIDLVYRPRSFLAGCLLSALAFLAAAVWWMPRPSGISVSTRSESLHRSHFPVAANCLPWRLSP